MTYTRNPEQKFESPRDLIQSDELTDTQKRKVLESWQTDLIELQKAEEENMPGRSEDPGETARRLSEVTAAIVALRAADEEVPAKPARAPSGKPDRPFRDVPKPRPIDNPKPPGPGRAAH